MWMSFTPLLLVGALGFAATAYAADQPASPHDHSSTPDPSGASASPALKGGKMPMTGKMNMGQMHCPGYSEPRLSRQKAELGITRGQLRAWKVYAEAVKANAGHTPGGMGMPMKPGDRASDERMMSKSLPERLAHHEMMMTAQLKALHKLRAAITDLYRVLTPAQQALAEASLCGGMAQLDRRPHANGSDRS